MVLTWKMKKEQLGQASGSLRLDWALSSCSPPTSVGSAILGGRTPRMYTGAKPVYKTPPCEIRARNETGATIDGDKREICAWKE